MITATLKFKPNHKDLIDPIFMVIRKSVLTALNRFAVIGISVSSGDNNYSIMENIGKNTINPMDIGLSLSKHTPYVRKDVIYTEGDKIIANLADSTDSSCVVYSNTYIKYEKYLNVRSLMLSNFSDILEIEEDAEIVRFTSEIPLKISLYIANIHKDTDSKETLSIIDSVSVNGDEESSKVEPIFNLPGVLFPGKISYRVDVSDYLTAEVSFEAPNSMKNDIENLIKTEISEIFGSVEFTLEN